MFYSQQNEDRILFEKYFNYKNGFFIELGAMNGVMYSNTKFFEDSLGWTGILIEPTNQFESLKVNRPKCYNFNCAISNFDGEIDFLGNQALGGILHSMHDTHRIGWGLDKQTPYKVKSVPFYEITKNIKVERIDFFSIDVEGGELEVLTTFDWSIPVYLVLIEMADHDKEKDEACRLFLLEKGFKKEMIIGADEVWININNKL